MRRIALAILLLSACRAPAPAPRVELLGERMLVGARREYDEKAWPVARVAGEALPAFELVAGARRVPAVAARTERRGDATLVWFAPVAPSLRGEGEIVARAEGGATARWPVTWHEPPESLPALREAVAHGAAGRHAEALRAIDAGLPAMTPRARHFALAERARALQRLGRTEEAIGAWRRAADDARALGWPGEAARCLRVASFVAFAARDINGTERLLDEAEALPATPWEQARRPLHRGYAAEVLGDYARAGALYREAAERAWALGADAEHATAVMAEAVLLLHEGRQADAAALLERVRPFFEARRADRRLYAAFITNRGWLLMGGRAPEDRPLDLTTARALYLEAREIYRDLGEPQMEAACLGRLARLSLLQGDVEGARRLQAEARAKRDGGADVPEGWLLLQEAEIELADGRRDAARALFARAAAEARDIGPDRDLLWRALYGTGRVAPDRAAARAAFAEALAVLDEMGRHTALAETRGAFYADRRPLVDDMVRLLLADGATAEALAVADAARARIARALRTRARVAGLDGPARQRLGERVGAWLRRRDAYERGRQQAWRLPAENLAAWEARRAGELREMQKEFEAIQRVIEEGAPAPADETVAAARAALEPGAALVAFTRLGREVHAFWLDGATLEHRRVTGDLLGPWRARTPSRLYVVPADVPEARALHRDPGLPPVGYLPYAGLLARATPAARGAPVVVADPMLDLPAARAEGERVARRLDGARLLLGDAARRDAVLAALGTARVFHFAGHGTLDPASPWDASLQLAGDARLTMADLLTTAVGSEVVVLGACETARTAALGDEHLGLADALVLAGARAVIAADRRVDDGAAAAFVDSFYAHDGARAPGPALRAAAAEVPEGEAFRLVGRP